MPLSLFGLQDPSLGLVISKRPYEEKYWPRYLAMQRPANPRADFGWKEVGHLQKIMRQGDIWTDFPARGYTLVNAEFKAADEDQRIDLLYLRDDGALLPCELKIGGHGNKDAHGQLIRYIADLYCQRIDTVWLRQAHQKFIDSIKDDLAQHLHATKFDAFLESNQIQDRFLRILPRTGLLIDIDFPPQLLKAIRYLNGYCGFAIRLLQIEAFVESDWRSNSDDYIFRLDFVDIQ